MQTDHLPTTVTMITAHDPRQAVELMRYQALLDLLARGPAHMLAQLDDAARAEAHAWASDARRQLERVGQQLKFANELAVVGGVPGQLAVRPAREQAYRPKSRFERHSQARDKQVTRPEARGYLSHYDFGLKLSAVGKDWRTEQAQTFNFDPHDGWVLLFEEDGVTPKLHQPLADRG